jgi:hypothetical protein
MSEELEMLCSILQISAKDVFPLLNHLYGVGSDFYYVSTTAKDCHSPKYHFFAQIGPYFVYKYAK